MGCDRTNRSGGSGYRHGLIASRGRACHLADRSCPDGTAIHQLHAAHQKQRLEQVEHTALTVHRI